jgi:8-oxo-dGTP diphosphatase
MDGFNEENFKEQARRDGITHYATGVAVFRYGKLLVIRRAKHDSLAGVYELPGGGVDEGETIFDGARRELEEEIGLKAIKLLAVFDGFDYTSRSGLEIRQANFKVEAEEGEIKLDPNEHDDFKWIDEKDIDNLATSDKQRQALYAAFRA